jgi:hypothetical protein
MNNAEEEKKREDNRNNKEMSHPFLRNKWSAYSYVRPEINHT